MVDAWLVSHSVTGVSSGLGTCCLSTERSTAGGGSVDVEVCPSSGGQHNANKNNSGAATPVRKISAHEFERSGLLRPLLNTIDGTLTFISSVSSDEQQAGGAVVKHLRRNRNELKSLDEKELIFELVKDICNDLDVRRLCHKILQVKKQAFTLLRI